MAYTQQTVTIPNRMYGDRIVTAYCKGGLGVHRMHKQWQIVHVASGANVGGRNGGDRRTRKGAYAVLEALLAVPVDWTKPFEEIRNEVQAHRDQILKAVATSPSL